ncbi:MAG: protein kinase [Myxococcota bacterium]
MTASDVPATELCPHCGSPHPITYTHCPRTGKPLATGTALVGKLFNDRWRVMGLLAEGGMGTVYIAEDTLLDRKVALKRLHPELSQNDKSLARFEREARAAVATRHQNIVEVYDLGRGTDGAPYMVMEYINGPSLRTVLRRHAPLSPSRACEIVWQVLAALRAVHAQRIVHRDLKPENILVERTANGDDHIKILDFGISKIKEDGDDDLHLTRTGVMLGTPYYMSPEQARGEKDLDHRVDLYAVGVLLYQCLSGKLPFDRDNYHALLSAILEDPLEPLHRVIDVPGELSELVSRSLEREPEARFQTAIEMAEALEPFRGGSSPTGPRGTRPVPRLKLGTPRISRPGPPYELPRSFVQSSADWEDEPLQEPVAPALSFTREDDAKDAETEATGPQVKATLIITAIQHVQDTFGRNAAEGLLDDMEIEQKTPLRGVLLPVAWVPLTTYGALLHAGETRLGSGSGAVAAELGRAAASLDLPQTHRLFLRNATPFRAIERLPKLFRAYHSTGTVTVIEGAPLSYRIVVSGLEPEPPFHAVAMVGFYRRLFELAGAKKTRATLVSSRARGDSETATSLRFEL